MVARFLADLVVALHFAFIAYVVAGGFVAWRWPRTAWIHALALAWGLWILATGAICPLTPLENSLRLRAGELGYEGGFIARYITPVIYPAGLTRGMQRALGAGLALVNLVAYLGLWWRARARRHVVP
ncbi:MAG: hypothetical protein NAOJABEB_01277 [Steroidobacteraceae bacterium]|nr:hypothetical protein [Steroidobacteraceae bacterium]